ncbi:hypothetical protein HOY82DRAFT_610885 [Tuber indicum]|nr:hypothetical protein HOY82DRAFT_610885 [Tuber indicum]
MHTQLCFSGGGGDHHRLAKLALSSDYLLFITNIPAPIVDILERTTQVGSIYQTLAQSGQWLEVDKSSIPELAMLPESGEHHYIGWFKGYDDQWNICLYSEDTYRPTVNTEKIQVPLPVNFNHVLVESEFHPNSKDQIPHDRSSLPNMITDKDV